MDLIKELNKERLEAEVTPVKVGDTVRVHVKVKEGSRERIQVFEGTVIAKKHGGITACQAVLSARPRGQGRQGQGKAVIQDEREAKASLFSCHTKFPRHLVILTVL